MTISETIRAAGASIAYPRRGSQGTPDGILVYGAAADVRRAAAAIGLSFERASDLVTNLRLDGVGVVGTLVAAEGRASFTVCEAAWQAMLAG